MPIDELMLLTAGYKKYKYPEDMCGDAAYQKCFKGTRGEKLYFVQAKLWKMPDGRGGIIKRVEFDARLYLPEGNTLVGSTGFTLQVHADDAATIQAVEAFYAKAFSALDCVPDLHNQ